jgi:hypothetical protein
VRRGQRAAALAGAEQRGPAGHRHPARTADGLCGPAGHRRGRRRDARSGPRAPRHRRSSRRDPRRPLATREPQSRSSRAGLPERHVPSEIPRLGAGNTPTRGDQVGYGRARWSRRVGPEYSVR